MYEKNKKLDVVEEPIIIQEPKEEEKKQDILDQIDQILNSSEPAKQESNDDQEL